MAGLFLYQVSDQKVILFDAEKKHPEAMIMLSGCFILKALYLIVYY
jgi:hypothetical protein